MSQHTLSAGQPSGQIDASSTRLHARRLILAWVLWGVTAIFELAAFVYSITGAVTQLQVLCTSSCAIQQLSAAGVSELQHAGLSLKDYIAFYLVVILVSTLLCYAMAALLLWRRPTDWMALLISLMLLGFAPGSLSIGVRFSQWFGPALAPHISSLFDQINVFILVLVFFLFPTGRFEPRWSRWFIYVLLGMAVVFVVFPRTTTEPALLIDIYDYYFIIILLSLVIAQVYRYRWVSSPAQRQQTKWVVYNLVVSITCIVGLLLIFQPLPGSLLSGLDMVANLLLTLIPISFAISIQRYRLYDIDILINRTLVYLTLTALLAGIYVGLIIALQSLLRSIINQNNAVALVISTLAIYVLIRPLRARIQAIIDRRFYRKKYDAARTLAAFSAVLRTEVDLNRLSEHLLAVVQETMQPSSISLWLRPPEQRGKLQNTEEGGVR